MEHNFSSVKALDNGVIISLSVYYSPLFLYFEIPKNPDIIIQITPNPVTNIPTRRLKKLGDWGELNKSTYARKTIKKDIELMITIRIDASIFLLR